MVFLNQLLYIMKKILTIFMLFIATSHLIAQSSTNGDTVYVTPSTSQADLSLITPPEGFVVSENFNGYIHYQMGAAIIMTLIEGTNYINISKGMTEEFYSANQLHFISKEKVETDNGLKGLSYKFYFTLKETDFIRYMIYVGDLNNVLWLSITYPKMGDELLSPEVDKVIQSIQLKPRKDEE